MSNQHVKHVLMVALFMFAAYQLPQVNQAFAQTSPVCPAGYTCTPVTSQPPSCPPGYVCVPTTTPPSSPTPVNTNTDATAAVNGSPILALTYNSNSKESALTANFNVSVYGGSQGINVYQYAGAQFVDSNGNNANLNSQTTVLSPSATSAGITPGIDNNGQKFYVVPAGKSGIFNVVATVNPQQMFAGTYSATLTVLEVNNSSNISNEFDLQVPTNQTNTKTIAGETSPYITSITPNVNPGQVMTISGQRLGGSTVYIDSAPVSAGGVITNATAGTLRFTLPSLSNGQHIMYVSNATTGRSNQIAFQVGSGTISPVGTKGINQILASLDLSSPLSSTIQISNSLTPNVPLAVFDIQSGGEPSLLQTLRLDVNTSLANPSYLFGLITIKIGNQRYSESSIVNQEVNFTNLNVSLPANANVQVTVLGTVNPNTNNYLNGATAVVGLPASSYSIVAVDANNNQLSVVGGPSATSDDIYASTLTFSSSGISTTPTVPVLNSGATVSATLVSANSDHASTWNNFAPGPGNNGQYNDFGWNVSLNLSSSKTIQSMTLIENNSGEGWSTSFSANNALGKQLYPLVVFNGGSQLDTAYDQTLGSYSAGTQTFTAYGQPESTIFNGGTLTIMFTDGTSATAQVPASTISVSPNNPVSTNPSLYSSVAVLSPNGGETVNLSNPLTVSFTPITGATLHINLMNGGVSGGHSYDLSDLTGGPVIGQATDKQSLTVSVPSNYNVPSGSQFKIEICATPAGGASIPCVYSSNYFSVISSTVVVTPVVVANPPVISSAPTSLVQGSTNNIQVLATNLAATGNDVKLTGASTVDLGSFPAVYSGSSLVFAFPSTLAAGTYSMTITNSNGTSAPYNGIVVSAPAGISVTSISPTSGLAGTSVTVTGSGFGSTNNVFMSMPVAGARPININIMNVPATSPTSLTFTIPTQYQVTAGTYNVIVQTGGVNSAVGPTFNLTVPATQSASVLQSIAQFFGL